MAFLSITQGQTRFSGLLAKKKKVSTLIFMPVTRWYPQESPFPEQGEEVRGLEKVAAADVVELELSPGRQSPGPCLALLPPTGATTSSQGAQTLLPALPGGSVGSWLTKQTMGVRSLTHSRHSLHLTHGGLVEISLPDYIDF